jgi:glycosyltransferase involved in cell wall biosynthesis
MSNDKKKRILVVTSTFPTFLKGDATPAFVYELSRRLANQYDVFVLAPATNETTLSEYKDQLNIRRFRYWLGVNLLADGAILPNIKKNYFLALQLPFFFLFQLLSMRQLCKKHDIDVIHAHWIIPSGLTAVIYKVFFNRKIKIMLSSHGSDLFALNGLLFTRLRRWVLKHANTITVVGNKMKQILQTETCQPIHVIPMGVDIDKFTPKLLSDSPSKRILFLGRLASEKRPLDLLSAFAECKNSHLTLTFAGDGPEKSLLEQFVQSNAVNNVSFLGMIEHKNVPELMHNHDIFVIASEREGMPVALVEAMSAGMLCIGSNIEQITDVITNGENGFIFPLGNTKQLAMLLDNIQDKPYHLDIIKRSIYSASKYEWQGIADDFKEQFDAI